VPFVIPIHAGRGAWELDRPRNGVHPRRSPDLQRAQASDLKGRGGRRGPVRTVRYSRGEVESAYRSGSGTARSARIETRDGPDATMNRSAANWIEVWHYRAREPAEEHPVQELITQFVTKDGSARTSSSATRTFSPRSNAPRTLRGAAR